MHKPETMEAYKAWLKEQHKVDITHQTEKQYETNAVRMQEQFFKSSFWQVLVAGIKLRDYDAAYRIAHRDYALLMKNQAPELTFKTFETFFTKTFRINILANKTWPQPPKWFGTVGWLLPTNWFLQINDIVRTRFVVKYFDGVQFLSERLRELATEHRCKVHLSPQSRDEGYYAYHVNLGYTFEILTTTWDTTLVDSNVEIQITTQLQDVIGRMIHEHYEKTRIRPTAFNPNWKWDQKCPEFATNYLGHILHYLEGMIVEIRDRREEAI